MKKIILIALAALGVGACTDGHEIGSREYYYGRHGSWKTNGDYYNAYGWRPNHHMESGMYIERHDGDMDGKAHWGHKGGMKAHKAKSSAAAPAKKVEKKDEKKGKK